MKKYLILLTIFSLLLQFAYSQTNVSGPYFTNQNWTLAGSPYNVIGDVQIPDGVTLTINPGVQINYSGDFEILIKGTLIANGTNLFPINFLGNNGGYPMIMFKSTNLSNSQITHTNFTGNKIAIQLAQESEFNQDVIKNSGTLYVKKMNLINSKIFANGYQTTASLIIDSSEVSNSSIRGYIHCEPIEVKNSNIYNHSLIHSDYYNPGITIRTCNIDSSEFRYNNGAPNFIIQSNIHDSYFNRYSGPYINIEDCQITNTPLNFETAQLINILRSNIYYDFLPSYSDSAMLKCSNLKMICSTVEGTGYGIAVLLYGGDNIIYNSSFKNNTIAIHNEYINSLYLDSSNFINNTLYNVRTYSSYAINARRNWWGYTDSISIASKIYDYYDNINYGKVFFSDWLSSIHTPTYCPNEIITTIPEYDNNETLNIRIFPNPFNNYTTIEFDNTNKINHNLTIYDYQERMVRRVNNITTDKIIIERKELANGLYFFKLNTDENNIATGKLLIE